LKIHKITANEWQIQYLLAVLIFLHIREYLKILIYVKTRNIALSYGTDVIVDNYYVLSQSTRLTDRQTDRKSIARAHPNRVRCVLKREKK